MISFSCAHCGMKLKVKHEFAGRSSRCPTCKQPLVVPAPDQTEAVPAGEIDGTSSSLHQAGARRRRHAGARHGRGTQRPASRSANSWPSDRKGTNATSSRARSPAAAWAPCCGPSIATSAARSPSSTCSTRPTRQEAPLRRGGADHRPAGAPQHRSDPRAGGRRPEAAVLLDEDGQGPQPGPGARRLRQKPEDSREGILAGAAAERLRQRLQRPGLRPLARRDPPRPEAGQHHGRRLRRSLRHGLGPGQGARQAPRRPATAELGRAGEHASPFRSQSAIGPALQQGRHQPRAGGRPDPGRRDPRHAGLHAARAGHRQLARHRPAQRRLLARGHPLRDADPAGAGRARTAATWRSCMRVIARADRPARAAAPGLAGTVPPRSCRPSP